MTLLWAIKCGFVLYRTAHSNTVQRVETYFGQPPVHVNTNTRVSCSIRVEYPLWVPTFVTLPHGADSAAGMELYF